MLDNIILLCLTCAPPSCANPSSGLIFCVSWKSPYHYTDVTCSLVSPSHANPSVKLILCVSLISPWHYTLTDMTCSLFPHLVPNHLLGWSSVLAMVLHAPHPSGGLILRVRGHYWGLNPQTSCICLQQKLWLWWLLTNWARVDYWAELDGWTIWWP